MHSQGFTTFYKRIFAYNQRRLNGTKRKTWRIFVVARNLDSVRDARPFFNNIRLDIYIVGNIFKSTLLMLIFSIHSQLATIGHIIAFSIIIS